MNDTENLREIKEEIVFDYHHEDLSSGGVYTEEELKSWSEKIMYGNLHSAIVKSLTLGVCNNQGTCPVASETPAYNLNNLLTTEGNWQMNSIL